ncbi:hypothetical protein, partial [Acidiferrobacter sp.]|uniref:hypothetical protein n=1 Tax=Acidiferrobacter sp. TaxID=1872107 RepID=UPI00262ECEC0
GRVTYRARGRFRRPTRWNMRTRGLHNSSQMAAFLSSLKSTAEQLTDLERLTLILRRAFAKFLQGRTYPAALLAPG